MLLVDGMKVNFKLLYVFLKADHFDLGIVGCTEAWCSQGTSSRDREYGPLGMVLVLLAAVVRRVPDVPDKAPGI